MPTDAVNDIVRVTTAWSYPDQQVIMNNLSYQCIIAGGSDTRAGLGAAVAAFMLSNYGPVVAAAANFYGWKVSSLNKSPTPAPVSGLNVTAGGAANPNCPTQARPILKLLTPSAGRKYRGRLFMPPPATAYVTAGGFPSTALNTVMVTVGNAIVTGVITGGSTWAPVIAHRVKKMPLSTTATLITGTSVPGLFGTQWKSGNTGRVNTPPW
jgi:hypothetical protein